MRISRRTSTWGLLKKKFRRGSVAKSVGRRKEKKYKSGRVKECKSPPFLQKAQRRMGHLQALVVGGVVMGTKSRSGDRRSRQAQEPAEMPALPIGRPRACRETHVFGQTQDGGVKPPVQVTSVAIFSGSRCVGGRRLRLRGEQRWRRRGLRLVCHPLQVGRICPRRRLRCRCCR